MTAYLLVFFVWTADGNVEAYNHTELYMGADLCQSKAAELEAQLEAGGVKENQRHVICVDSKLYPGIPS